MTTTAAGKSKKTPRKSSLTESKKSKAGTELNKTNLFFLGLAGAAVIGSALLTLSHSGKKKLLGHFIGLWVPSLLSLSLYSKVSDVKNEVLDVVKH